MPRRDPKLPQVDAACRQLLAQQARRMRNLNHDSAFSAASAALYTKFTRDLGLYVICPYFGFVISPDCPELSGGVWVGNDDVRPTNPQVWEQVVSLLWERHGQYLRPSKAEPFKHGESYLVGALGVHVDQDLFYTLVRALAIEFLVEGDRKTYLRFKGPFVHGYIMAINTEATREEA